MRLVITSCVLTLLQVITYFYGMITHQPELSSPAPLLSDHVISHDSPLLSLTATLRMSIAGEEMEGVSTEFSIAGEEMDGVYTESSEHKTSVHG